jgi:ABC-2 type transport system ATP-binding protein
MIRTIALSKRYGSIQALDGLDLEVPIGSIMALLGPNGAGKTTLLRAVMGFIHPDEGQIDRGGLPPARIGYLPERAFYPPLSKVGDYLTLIGRLAGLRRADLRRAVPRLLSRLELTDVAGRRLGACSRGMLQRVGIAQALLGDPPLLLLDEPVSGLDPAGQKFIRDQILDLHREGKTVLLSSHNLSEVTRVCTHVSVISRGRLVRAGPMESILPPLARTVIGTSFLPADLQARLTLLDPGIVAADEWVSLLGDARSCKPEVLRLLLQAGVDIRGLEEQKATLEEVYLEVTGG